MQQKIRNLLERLFGRKQKSMVVDSGASSHFVRKSDNLPKIGPSNKVVNLPNGAMIQSTHRVQLPFTKLTDKAREAHVLPDLKAHSLISVPKLSDEGYITLFLDGQKGVVVYKANDIMFTAKGKPVLKGCRDLSGLWKIESSSQPESKQAMQQLHNVYDLPSTETAIRFLHAAAGFPVKATWIAAIKNGNYATWPNLTADLVEKYFPESTATQKGHMKKQRQNVRSTKVKTTMQDVPEEQTQQKHREIYIKIYNAHDTIYTDQTGCMPIVSNRGNRLVMVVFEVDSNYIDAEPLKDSTDRSLIQAYHTLWSRLTASGAVKPKLHILDNEVSIRFRAEIKKNSAMQLVPPDTHRRNLAECAIQTFKSHFIAVLSGVDESFPMPLWDRLLPQAVMTLNMLRQSRANPKVSAYEYVNGKFDYNKMPLAPMGCAVQVHISPNRRLTWAAHSLDGWYLRTSDEHYRCHVVFVKRTCTNEYLTQYFSSTNTSLIQW